MKKKSTKKSRITPEYDSQRQQNVLLERIEKKVDTIAEGHSGLGRKIDKTNERLDEMDGRLQIISSNISGHSSKLAEHDKRFDRIESVVLENSRDIKEVKANVERIEQKLDTVTTEHERRIQKSESPVH
ncbi:MAG: hypothetical protein KJ957_02730 [Candidatus Omnitrophica bacterium]|nr:hypothetical protein [Candidatus Omnitrophota bacterium]